MAQATHRGSDGRPTPDQGPPSVKPMEFNRMDERQFTILTEILRDLVEEVSRLRKTLEEK